MDKKHKHQKGGKTHIPAADSFTNYDHSGWMSRLYNDGWLKKRWRKRYCVLSNGKLYLYEKQTAKGTEAASIAIDLAKFSSCIKASGKELKKSPNTIILEPTVPTSANGEKEQNNNVAREFFFTDDAVDIDKWMLKLKESLSLSCAGTKAKLEHVTKSRARPPKGGGGNRRPPTKQHIKERARMSEIVMDEEQEEPRKSARESRGHLPVIAMKPTGKPILPNSSRNVEKKSDAEKPPVDELEATNDLHKPSEQDKPDSDNTKSPPKLPPTALKPKPKLTDKPVTSEENNSSSEHSEEHLNQSERIDAPVDLSTGNESELSESATKSPPKLPPTAMKPKLEPSETAENGDENDPIDDANSKSSTADSESSVAALSLSSTEESSPKQNRPPALPPVALKPKVTPEKSKPPAVEQILAEDSNKTDSQATVINRSNCDLGDDAPCDEMIGDSIIRRSDISRRKSLTNLKLSDEHENTQCRNRSKSF